MCFSRIALDNVLAVRAVRSDSRLAANILGLDRTEPAPKIVALRIKHLRFRVQARVLIMVSMLFSISII